jgi:subtilase family serine protease
LIKLDVEWAHAIAPKAKILLIEVPTPSGANLTKGIDYARSRSEVVAVSMSWGGKEFSDETNLDSHFKNTPIKFFASSGDNGAGASWPAASPFVISVGGTSLKINSNGNFLQETAWTGSSGGISKYESEPSWQKAYNILQAKGKRAIPDVAYNADPHSGFSVYFNKGWYVLGGTSAGAPQWAAIEALGHSVDITKLYQDKSQNDYASFFRDITSGRNGDCVYYCVARRHYDYVTGLGTPQTVDF